MHQTTHNDKPILDLAVVVARYHRLFTVPEMSSVARLLLVNWETYQGKEYLDGQDNDVPEKRIYILLDLLVHSATHGTQRRAILKLIADNLDSYAMICASCPSGAFSENLHVEVIDILSEISY